MTNIREVFWVGSSLKDLKSFPEDVQDEVGYSLHQVQIGRKPDNAKSLRGLESGMMEIVSDYDKDTYRVIYALKVGRSIYVLHAFQKKSHKGIKTPKHEIDLIRQRLKLAKEHAKGAS